MREAVQARREEGAGQEGAREEGAPAKKAAAKKAAAAAEEGTGQEGAREEGTAPRRAAVTAADHDGRLLHHRRRAGVGVGVVAGRTRAAQRLAAAAAARAPRLQRRRARAARDGDPPPGVLARLVEELEADEDRSVVPVRVFWVPGGLPTRSKVVGADVGPRHLPAAGDAAAPHPASGTRRAPAWWPASPRRFPNCASSGATPPSARTRATSPISSSGARSWRSNASSCGCSGPSTSRPSWSSRRCWRRRGFAKGWRRFPARRVEQGGRDARRTRHRLEPVLRRPDPVAGPRDLQPGIRPEHRLRPRRGRAHAARAGNPPGGAAVLAPVLPRRRDRAGGDAGEPAAAGAHVRRHQPVVRVHGAADAPLRASSSSAASSTTRCTSTCSGSSSATSSRSGST